MLLALLFLVTLAAAAWAVAESHMPRSGRVPAALLRLAGLFALEHLLSQACRLPLPPGAFPVLVVARALAGIALWAQLAWLSAYGKRTKAGGVRKWFAVVTIVFALFRAPWVTLFFLALPAVLSFGWRAALGTRQLFVTALGAIALLALATFARVPGPAEPTTHGAVLALLNYARWANAVAIAYLAAGTFRTLDAFVRDPSLGIRTVRRRLALSHVLVVGVPLLIVSGMWVLTTWLGVNAERAVVAMHAIEADAAGLRSSLVQALRTPGDPRATLAAVAASRRREWPNVRVWHVEAGRVDRVAGDSVAWERELAGWCARLDSLPASGVVQLGTHRYLGACARDSVRGAFGIALVPVMEALAGSPSRVSGALLSMAEVVRFERSAEADSLDTATDREDSAAVEKTRRLARRFGVPDSVVRKEPVRPGRRGTNARIVTARDTIVIADADEPPDSTGAAGSAAVHGALWGDMGWIPHDFRMRARVTLEETLVGLFRNVKDNPYNFIPILILAALVTLLMPVASFNFRLVRQLGRSFTQPVAALREGTRALGESRLDYRIPVQGDDELWDAAQAFNRMSEGLERARETEIARDRLERELDLARRIQQRLLPSGPPAVPGLEIAGLSVPAREVGGDYFDHIPLGDGRVMLVIADVSGKGVPAALLMSAFRASLMSQEAGHRAPGEVAERLNEFLHRSVDPGKFVTAFVGFLDGRTGQFAYANAGHNPPAVLRADGRVEWLATGGLILGIMAGARFDSGSVTLEPGDLLAMYTDGVTEAADATTEQFGEDRMVASLLARRDLSCERLAKALVDEVKAFEGESGPADDVTLLLARVQSH